MRRIDCPSRQLGRHCRFVAVDCDHVTWCEGGTYLVSGADSFNGDELVVRETCDRPGTSAAVGGVSWL